MLNSFFTSACTEEDKGQIPEIKAGSAGPIITDVVITTDLVQKKMARLRPSSAAGPDGVHPQVFKETDSSLLPQLAKTYRKTMDTGTLPPDWKLADVVPIYKKGSRDDPGNYRPVSLTSVPCKIIKAIIRDQLMSHLLSENLLSDAQHGFRPDRSCVTQLLLAIEDWSSMVENGEPVDVLYLDLAKALNTVPPKRLLKKVEAHGIGGKVLRWIGAFLEE